MQIVVLEAQSTANSKSFKIAQNITSEAKGLQYATIHNTSVGSGKLHKNSQNLAIFEITLHAHLIFQL